MKYPKKLLKPIREFLEKREKELRKRNNDLKMQDPFNDTERKINMASADGAVQERVDHARVEAMKREVDKTLVRIRKALTHIKLGTYGTCEGCRKMIDTDRLAIDPSTTYCVKCEKKREKAL